LTLDARRLMEYFEPVESGAISTQRLDFLSGGELTAITLRVPKNLKEAAAESARLHGVSFSAFVRSSLIEKLSKGIGMSYNRRLASPISSFLVAAFALVLLSTWAFIAPSIALANEQGGSSDENRYYYDIKVNTGRDNGYSGFEEIGEDDPHFSWDLGHFVVSGFTSRADDNGTPVFLKNSGDQVQLFFVLDQDIDALDSDEKKRVGDDKNGYDQQFEVGKSDEGFGRGALIVRYTDFQNSSTDPQVYRDYLPALVIGAETEINLCEEGDYEVALDYEVETIGDIPVVSAIPLTHQYDNYRIVFRFKVRNSNTMMFLFDTETNNELFNGSVTPNGFRIDLAGSRYLDVSVKREVMNEARDGLSEDTRFNRTAADGDSFTEEGIYTIKVKNPSTGEDPTEKRIYVGDDDVLKAVVANHMDVADVEQRIEDGAVVGDDGKLAQASAQGDAEDASSSETGNQGTDTAGEGSSLPIAVPIAIAVAAVAAVLALLFRKRGLGKADGSPHDEDGDAK
jgi:hypothetical protein